MTKFRFIIWLVLVAISGTLHAEEYQDWSIETWGKVTFDSRIFQHDPAGREIDQAGSNQFSLTFEPTVYMENADGNSFTFSPYVLVDSLDNERTHVDVREAYFLTYGLIGESEWELRLGVDQVFWGVAESSNPVNIVNQTDLVVHPDGKTKLGQPMIQGTLTGDWGMFNLIVMPYHRPRTFAGPNGRLGLLVPVETSQNQIEYTSSSGRNNIDLAARYSNSLGSVDFGISLFDGTSRDPELRPQCKESSSEIDCITDPKKWTSFIQHYHLIKQMGLDVQITMGPFLGKAEWIAREETRKNNNKSRYHASVIGGEYAIYGIFESDADLTMLAEWNHDTRGPTATTNLQNDLFLAGRYAFNDIMDTEITVAIVEDMDYSTRNLIVEFNRRLSDSFSLSAEVFGFLQEDQSDMQSRPIFQDEYVSLEISYGF